MTLVLSLVLAATPVDPELLRRVGEHLSRLDQFERDSSFTVSVRAEELDGDGKVTHTEESVLAATVKNGETSRSVVRKSSDGKDVDAAEAAKDEAKKEQERKERRGGKRVTMQSTLPFASDEQKKYRFEPLPESPQRPGLVHVAFQPAGEKAPELLIGDALIDAASGELVHVDMRPSKNPTFVDTMWMAVELSAPTPAGRAVSGFDVTGSGSIAFIKKRMRVTTRVSDYRALKPAPDAAR